MKRLFMAIIFLFMMITISFGGSGEFSWDLNTDDTIGYNFYERGATETYFQADGATFNPNRLIYTAWSPDVSHKDDAKNGEYIINAEERCEITLSVPTQGVRYWVISAIDDANNESGASNEVNKRIDDVPQQDPQGFSCQ